MDEQPIGVWVLTVRATAGPANSEPDGLRYDILVFARGESEDGARAAGLDGLRRCGWDTPDIVRAGEIVDAGAVPDDLRAPMQRALRDGCALVVYDG